MLVSAPYAQIRDFRGFWISSGAQIGNHQGYMHTSDTSHSIVCDSWVLTSVQTWRYLGTKYSKSSEYEYKGKLSKLSSFSSTLVIYIHCRSFYIKW